MSQSAIKDLSRGKIVQGAFAFGMALLTLLFWWQSRNRERLQKIQNPPPFRADRTLLLPSARGIVRGEINL